ncbi:MULTISPECIES: glutaredoxin family protein [Bacillus]|uniref:Glutaredoxin n=2 Tax=Bacillus TaxID=1386 RepID=A0A0M4FHK0_9BACI|nr:MULTISPECIES: glutaredoxin family protein [Bacillus]ALC80554.1 glutaredoxin [Bacillus gobiensis]MBP1083637.1 glutaredoxin [Bacillus capparidis]MED1094830.1 glutaredoxin family protein [Bacillus capparidis]
MSNTFSVIVWSKEGCHYCEEVKQYLKEKQVGYQTIDVTDNDDRRDILEAKYGVRHVPVVEIGKNGIYEGVTKVGIDHVEKALAPYLQTS